MMRFYQLLTLFIATCHTIEVAAQMGVPFPKGAYLAPYRLEITHAMTSNLVFPDAISSIDRGSLEILTEKAEGVENILRVKAKSKGFTETNLSVITKNGTLYSFVVCYNAVPPYLNVALTEKRGDKGLDEVKENAALQQSLQGDAPRIRAYMEKALRAAAHRKSSRVRRAGVLLALHGFFIREDVLFCRITLDNTSAIGYRVDGLRFFLRDKKVPRRTASQEIEVEPLHASSDGGVIESGAHQTLILALPAFTIPRGKYLAIELTEARGGRHLELRISNRKLLNAEPLNP